MSTNAVEREVQRTAAKWAFIQRVETVDKTDDAIKLRLHIDTDCYIQVYTETQQILQDEGIPIRLPFAT